MSKTVHTDTPWSQWTIATVGGVMLAIALAGALYFFVQLDVPTVLVVVIGLLVVAFAVGRFYLVATINYPKCNRPGMVDSHVYRADDSDYSIRSKQ